MSYIQNNTDKEFMITGLGITSSLGQGKNEFSSAIIQGKQNFTLMKRVGRQNNTSFIGAEMPSLLRPELLSERIFMSASLTSKAALVTLDEAWKDANLDEVDSRRIGLVIGGSNLQQRELMKIYEKHMEQPHYIRPRYGVSFLDSDICGLCTEYFCIHGFAYTVGGASASGQVAILQAIQAIQTGQVDVCIAMGALSDLSFWELQALHSLGAMGTENFTNSPEKACRPFDRDRNGFIYGESCGVVVLESLESSKRLTRTPYARISGWAMCMDGNRNPNPSYEGECFVIRSALKRAGISANNIDYINPHGTGSRIGDEIELKAIINSNLSHAYINTTKSLIGHGLSAAGTVEIIATLLQMKLKQLHPSKNLDQPISLACNWVKEKIQPHAIENSLNLSMGFGGFNTAICLENIN